MPTSAVKLVTKLLTPPKSQTKRTFFRVMRTLLSRTARVNFALFVCAILLLSYQPNGQSQSLRAEVTIRPANSAKVQVELELPDAVDSLSFRNTYASVLGLAERIGSVQARGATGDQVGVQKVAPGEFRTSVKVARFSYEVDVTEPSRLENLSHISWLNSSFGLLMPADLLPISTKGSGQSQQARIHLNVPAGWRITSNAEADGKDALQTSEPDKAVFLIGQDLQTGYKTSVSPKLSFTTAGGWPFSNEEALKAAAKIIGEYTRVTGFSLVNDVHVMLIPFSGSAAADRWTAEARGNAVVLLMSNAGNRKQRLRRLQILLSHELFHLWVPNSLKLDGDYDWFFEGFTLYQALLTDLRLGLITFDTFLETIGRVYRSYLAGSNRDNLSLIEASERRWTTSPSLVYDKGMLLAFLYDLKLRSNAQCRAVVTDVYRDLFQRSATGQRNANETIIRLLSERPGMESFTREFIERSSKIEFASQVSPYGLHMDFTAPQPRLEVRADATKAQRQVLLCLANKN